MQKVKLELTEEQADALLEIISVFNMSQGWSDSWSAETRKNIGLAFQIESKLQDSLMTVQSYE